MTSNMDSTSTGPALAEGEHDDAPEKFDAGRGFAWFLLIAGVVGFVAAFDLTVEKIALLKDPSYELSCNINPLLSCGSIVTTPQAEVFGFPNPLLGIAGFSVVITTGVALLAGAAFRRWYWIGLTVGSGLGTVFVGWLIYQSLFEIGALCPYCMVVWAVTIPIFLYSLRQTLQQSQSGSGSTGDLLAGTYVRNTHWLLVIVYVTIVALIGIRFWDYWSTLL